MKTKMLIVIALFISASLFAQNCTYTKPCIPAPDNLVGWWAGDNDATDLAGNHNGVLMNGTSFGHGQVCSGFLLDGIDDYVSIEDDPLWTFGSNDFTIDLWANFSSLVFGAIWEPRNSLVACDEGSGWINKWIYHLNGYNMGFIIAGPGNPGAFLQVPFTPVLNQWYHLAVVRSGNLFIFYANGAVLGTRVCNVPIPDPNTPLTIGNSEGSTTLVHGILDEVDIFNRALSASEINQIYNAGCDGKCKGVSCVSITPGGPTSFCEGGAVTLTASEGSTYLWSTGASTRAIDVNTPGDYCVLVTDALGCSDISLPTTVTVYPIPIVSAGDNQTIGLGQSVTLNATIIGGTAPYAYLWNTGETTQNITVSPSVTTIYSVSITDVNSCIASASVTITVLPCNSFPCGNNKVQICHIPPGNSGNPQTLCISTNALPGHLAHGDYCGPCLKDAEANNPETPLVTKFDVAPNPFTDKTTFNFSMEESTQVQIDVYDMFGHQITSLFNAEAVSGKEYTIEFNSKNLPKGIYLYRAVTPRNVYSGKMLLQ